MSFKITLNRTEFSDGWFHILDVGWVTRADGCNRHRMGSYQRRNADHRACTIRFVPSRMCRTEFGRVEGSWSGLHLHGLADDLPAYLAEFRPLRSFAPSAVIIVPPPTSSRTTSLQRTDEPQRAQRAQRRNADHRVGTIRFVPWCVCRTEVERVGGPGVEYVFMAAPTTCQLT
jgi:hypothetical protein